MALAANSKYFYIYCIKTLFVIKAFINLLPDLSGFFGQLFFIPLSEAIIDLS
jgi:hypothetical protein